MLGKRGGGIDISTHAPARGATALLDHQAFIVVISTHAPARGATKLLGQKSAAALISTHAPARGATAPSVEYWIVVLFQPTLLHEERRLAGVVQGILHCISTHAPARGATCRCLPWPGSSLYFNPRSCTRSDGAGPRSARTMVTISTHAPARGATLSLLVFDCLFLEFQPTLLHEERRFAPALSAGHRPHFNPRSCTRSDHRVGAASPYAHLFQPTLLHEERPRRPRVSAGRSYFNPRSCTRSDLGELGSLITAFKFQPTLLHEERPCLYPTLFYKIRLFQPTLLHEERPSDGWKRRAKMYFNPRSCTRSDLPLCGIALTG